MKRFTGLIVIALCAMLLPVTAGPVAVAQGEPQVIIDQVVAADATGVANVTVISTHTVELGDMPHTIYRVAVDNVLAGEVPGEIYIEMPGGERADGSWAIWSHTPTLSNGVMVQVALKPSPSELVDVVTAGTGQQAQVYSLVSRERGVAPIGHTSAASLAATPPFLIATFASGGLLPTLPRDFRVNPTNAGRISGISASATITAARRGFDLWENDPGSNVDFTYRGTSGATGLDLNGVALVSWQTPSSANQLGNSLAVASIHFDGSIGIEFDVILNSNYSWSNGVSGGWDIGTVVGHEVGHGLGLTHNLASDPVVVPGQDQLMHFSISNQLVKPLGEGDRQGIASLYPILDCPATTAFVDVLPGLYFSDPVKWAECTGIVNGTSATTFEPLQPITRAQMAAVLWRFSGSPPAEPHPFTDVPPGSYYDSALNWLHQEGITTGTSPGVFSPNGPVTRGQMAAFIWRLRNEPGGAPTSQFADVSTSAYYSEAVDWMAASAITTGTTPTTFGPAEVATRAHAVTFLWRLAGQP